MLSSSRHGSLDPPGESRLDATHASPRGLPQVGLHRVRSHALFVDTTDVGDAEDNIILPKKVDFTETSPDLRYSYGHHSMQGVSSKMEDRVVVEDWSLLEAFQGRFRRVLFCAVLDGHAGCEAVNYLAASVTNHVLSRAQPCASASTSNAGEHTSSRAHTNGHSPNANGSGNGAASDQARSGPSPSASHAPAGGASLIENPLAALREALLACERELLAADVQSGSTALLALMLDDHLYLANVGDCRAVVCDDGEARQLTRDHKADANKLERERLEAVGAVLSSDGYVQVTHEDGSCLDVMVTRNLGCAPLKRAPSGLRLSTGLPPRCPSTSSMHSLGSASGLGAMGGGFGGSGTTPRSSMGAAFGPNSSGGGAGPGPSTMSRESSLASLGGAGGGGSMSASAGPSQSLGSHPHQALATQLAGTSLGGLVTTPTHHTSSGVVVAGAGADHGHGHGQDAQHQPPDVTPTKTSGAPGRVHGSEGHVVASPFPYNSGPSPHGLAPAGAAHEPCSPSPALGAGVAGLPPPHPHHPHAAHTPHPPHPHHPHHYSPSPHSRDHSHPHSSSSPHHAPHQIHTHAHVPTHLPRPHHLNVSTPTHGGASSSHSPHAPTFTTSPELSAQQQQQHGHIGTAAAAGAGAGAAGSAFASIGSPLNAQLLAATGQQHGQQQHGQSANAAGPSGSASDLHHHFQQHQQHQQHQLQGGLASSSSNVLIPDPELFHYSITQDSEFLLLACDGLWDVLRNNEAVRMVRRMLCDGQSAGESATKLCEHAIKLGSTDNVTGVLLRFSDRPLPSPATNSMLRRAPSRANATTPT